jgi:hypothetical protein
MFTAVSHVKDPAAGMPSSASPVVAAVLAATSSVDDRAGAVVSDAAPLREMNGAPDLGVRALGFGISV